MGKSAILTVLKDALRIMAIFMLGCVAIIFSVLYINELNVGLFLLNKEVVVSIIVGLISIFCSLTIAFFHRSNSFIYKLFYLLVAVLAVVFAALYLLKSSGFLDKVDSIDEFRSYISQFGNLTVALFILIQFLQVVVLPIPAFITVGAGVLLFGPFWGAIYSCIGIISGSLVGFFIGRFFGFKVAKWLVGERNLQKGLEAISGKDRVVLTFMFLFPFFPDDVLCFVAGITTVSVPFFTVMIFITRIISIFASSFSMNNNIIPFNTWWGIVLWGLFFALTIALTVLIYKKGDKIEKFILRKKKSVK